MLHAAARATRHQGQRIQRLIGSGAHPRLIRRRGRHLVCRRSLKAGGSLRDGRGLATLAVSAVSPSLALPLALSAALTPSTTARRYKLVARVALATKLFMVVCAVCVVVFSSVLALLLLLESLVPDGMLKYERRVELLSRQQTQRIGVPTLAVAIVLTASQGL